jgi:hypothetical protein
MIKSFLFLCFTLIHVQIFSQVEIGIKGGPTFSWIQTTGNFPDDFEVDQKIKPGFYVGATTDILLSSKWFLSPELYYIQRGNRTEGRGLSLSYLTMPVNVTFYPDPAFGIQAGLALGYLLAYRIGGNRVPDGGEDFDFGIQGGIIYRISEEISLTARYYNELNSINSTFVNDPDGNLIEEVKNLNRSIEAGIVFYIEWR